jgi:hypothetical protein
MTTLRCKEAFMAWVNGEPRTIPAGFLVDSRDSVVKGREALFDKVEEYVEKWGRPDRVEMPKTESRVEEATAAPGERRSLGRPRVEAKPDDKPESKPESKPSPRAAAKKDGEV